MSAEWKGPWKCEKCGKEGSSEWGEMVMETGHHFASDDVPCCEGRLLPVERRRAPAPRLCTECGKELPPEVMLCDDHLLTPEQDAALSRVFEEEKEKLRAEGRAQAPAPSADVRRALEWCLPYVEQARLLMALTEQGRKDLQEEIDEARATLSQPAPSADGLRELIDLAIKGWFDDSIGPAEFDARMCALRAAALPAPQEAKGRVAPFDGQSFSAADWAKAFCERNPTIDEGTMIGWFANAIMRGYDEAERKYHPAPVPRSDGLRAAVEKLKSQWEKRYPISDGPSVPWYVMVPFEKQCERNHSQSLKRIAERGGFAACEAYAVTHGIEYRRIQPQEHKRLWIEFAEKVNRDHADRFAALLCRASPASDESVKP